MKYCLEEISLPSGSNHLDSYVNERLTYLVFELSLI